MDEAGYKPGADGVREGKCDGQKCEANRSSHNTTTAATQLRANVQTLVQENLKDIGVEFTPDNKRSPQLCLPASPMAARSPPANMRWVAIPRASWAGGDPSPSDNFKLSGIPTAKNPTAAIAITSMTQS